MAPGARRIEGNAWGFAASRAKRGDRQEPWLCEGDLQNKVSRTGAVSESWDNSSRSSWLAKETEPRFLGTSEGLGVAGWVKSGGSMAVQRSWLKWPSCVVLRCPCQCSRCWNVRVVVSPLSASSTTRGKAKGNGELQRLAIKTSQTISRFFEIGWKGIPGKATGEREVWGRIR